jgi:hypothetical protein
MSASLQRQSQKLASHAFDLMRYGACLIILGAAFLVASWSIRSEKGPLAAMALRRMMRIGIPRDRRE